MKKKTILLGAAAVMMVASLSVAGMLAYFTDTESAQNTFTAGQVAITLTETAEQAEGVNPGTAIMDGETITGYTYKLFPGQSYAKVPVVTVDTGSEDAYLVVKVTISNKEALYKAFDVAEGEALSLIGADALISGGIALDADAVELERSEPADKDSIVYTFWFKNAATAEETFTLFEQINVPGTFDNDEMAALNNMTIDIVAYAVQTVGFDNVKDAYQAAFPG